MIYPLRIPENPRFFTVNEECNAFSMLFRFNKSTVSVIGDEEMKDLYNSHMGHFIYGVGTKNEKHKNGKTYHNIKLRGWLLVKMRINSPKGEVKRKTTAKVQKKES
ncbi:hypothetical protein NEF87_004298 [Candidatus Lokiarchaeum ossiferum]|uniref:Uncharacterized protein n=1 Tax=Candidatus Lokiarchaeum ossiferum TaxID=2951803 RepID=A0ABY6HWV9_9ARCH|nr:hypothetical protein NEF87_004298 [Candidatus Lokiarchaeum sp. B-35]